MRSPSDIDDGFLGRFIFDEKFLIGIGTVYTLHAMTSKTRCFYHLGQRPRAAMHV